MKVNLDEKQVLILQDLINSEVKDIEKGIKTIKDFPNKESLGLINSLKDRITMLEEIKENLQNIE